MREHEDNSTSARDPEATAVRPLFDDVAADVARPVVPLTDRAVAEDVVTYVGTGNAPHVYARAWKRRTHWMFALIFASLFAGTVAGVVGLRVYQKSRAKSVAPAQEQTPAAAEVPPPSSPVAANEVSAAPAQEQTPAVTVASHDAATDADAKDANVRDANDETLAPAGGRERVVAGRGEVIEKERASVRGPSTEESREDSDKRGKKGEDDFARGERTSSRVYDTQGAAPYGSEAERRAAREDAKLRRAERMARREGRRERRGEPRARMVDSIRGIFEGRTDSPPR